MGFLISFTPFSILSAVVILVTTGMLVLRRRGSDLSYLPLLYWAVMLAHSQFFRYGYSPVAVGLGTACALLLRFAKLSGMARRAALLGEAAVLLYMIWRSIGLILLW